MAQIPYPAQIDAERRAGHLLAALVALTSLLPATSLIVGEANLMSPLLVITPAAIWVWNYKFFGRERLVRSFATILGAQSRPQGIDSDIESFLRGLVALRQLTLPATLNLHCNLDESPRLEASLLAMGQTHPLRDDERDALLFVLTGDGNAYKLVMSHPMDVTLPAPKVPAANHQILSDIGQVARYKALAKSRRG